MFELELLECKTTLFVCVETGWSWNPCIFFRIGKKGGRCKFLGLLVSPPHCPPRIGNETCVTESEKSGNATRNCQSIFRKTITATVDGRFQSCTKSRVDHWFYHLLQVQLLKLQQRGVKLHWDPMLNWETVLWRKQLGLSTYENISYIYISIFDIYLII